MDNYIVSARKYRPSTFQSVVGQKSLTRTLKNAIEGQKLAHAYLFCGPRGVGKTTCARIFAKTINCLSPTPDGEACNCCESCVAFNKKRSYNIAELDAASNNSVDEIRSLTEQVRIPPQIGKYKVYIVDEVHMLSSAAFNAFLKTLEEPPLHAVFILATTEKHKIIPTILSRCQIYDFQRITIADIVDHLAYVSQSEGATAEPEALNIIAQKADGGMRDALSILDQVISFTGGNITYQAVIDNLNMLDYEYYFRLMDAFLQHNVPQSLLLFNEILSKGFEGQYFVTGLGSHLRDLLVCKDPSTLPLLEVAPSVAQHYGEQAKMCDPNILFKAIELNTTCDLNYRTSRNKRLLVELMLIQICQLGVTPTTPTAESPTLQKVTAQPVAQPSKGVLPTPATPVATPAPIAMPRTAPKTMAPKGGAIPSISIRKTAATPQEVEQQRAQEVELNTPFDETKLRQTWLEYTQTLDSTEAVLINMLISCQPSLQQGYTFEVVVDNQDQMKRLLDHSPLIVQYLKKKLQNTHIKMGVRESEKREKRRAFSQRERFDLMVTENSHLVEFKDRFGLELA